MNKLGRKLTTDFILILALAIISLSGYGTTYYVSNSGDDSNSGRSTSAPWKTLDKVNSYNFSAGDQILFQRGHSWFGYFSVQSGNSSGYITYASYGSGEKPMIHYSVDKDNESDWVRESGNIWSTVSSFPHEVGNIIFNHDQSVGYKRWSTSTLTQQGDFYFDTSNKKVKFYSSSNPASYYSKVKLTLNHVVVDITNSSYVIIKDLAVMYSAHDAIRSGGNAHHLIIKNIDAGFHGGGKMTGELRFGGGIGFWADATDILIEGCRIWDNYDAGVSNQSSVACTQSNITYKDNVIWNCEYSFEFFNSHSSAVTKNIQFINNTCYNAGYGWAHAQRPDKNGMHICFWKIPASAEGMVIENNIFYNAVLCPLYLASGSLEPLSIDYNCYYQTSGKIAELPVNYFWENQFEAYKSYTGFDSHSYKTNPQFKNLANHDFSLTSQSICIDNGNPAYEKDPDNTISDIGAIYYPHTVVSQPVYTSEVVSICEGENYLGWTVAGEYERTLASSTGVDSIVSTTLIVNPTYNIVEEVSIAAGESYFAWTTSGHYQRDLVSVSGCDSIVTTYLTIQNTINTTEYVSICEGESYMGWNTNGVYERTLTSSSGDSIVTTYLTVNPNYYIQEEITIIEGDNYLGWTTSGQYERQLVTSQGCDSIVVTNLTVSFNPTNTQGAGATYYVSNTGNDYNSGTSTQNAWRTLEKVNSYSFLPGDKVLFKKGDAWMGQIKPKSGTSSAPITYGAYGAGNKPVLHQSVTLGSTQDWTQESYRIWSTNYSTSSDVGNISFNNEQAFGVKKWSQSDLHSQGDFYYEPTSGKTKIYSTSNPASYYSNVSLFLTKHIVDQNNGSYITYESLHLTKGGAHGVWGGKYPPY